MLDDSLGDGIVFAIVKRVVAPHHPLEFGEFADHLGDEIGFAQAGGEFGLVFQETSVRRMTYEGPPVVFRIDRIANDIGASVPGRLLKRRC